MPTREELQEEGSRYGPLGMAGSAAWDIGSWQYSWSTLHMLRDGAQGGYYVPWTKVGKNNSGVIANVGRSFGWWGDEGLRLGGVSAGSNATFSRAGILGYSSASRTVAERATAKWANRIGIGAAGARQEIGEAVAARYIRRYGLSVGERAATVAGAKYLIGRAAGLAIPVLNVLMAAEMGYSIATKGYNMLADKFGKQNLLELGGYFPETQAAYTSRQRAVQAITASQLQARSAIGNEAMLFHRGAGG